MLCSSLGIQFKRHKYIFMMRGKETNEWDFVLKEVKVPFQGIAEI